MMHLLFSVIFSEMFVILLLLFRTPFRKFVIMGLDRMKRGRGPVIVTTVAGTVLVLFISTVNGIIDISRREIEPGAINPTDQVLMVRSLLDASLMGFILFLGLMIDRLHHYIRELRLLRKTMEATKKQTRSFDDGNNGTGDEAKVMADELTSLKNKVKILESECAAKKDEAKTAQTNADALKRQSEGLLEEYDRVLKDNQDLRCQLRDIDGSLSHADGKKKM
ncbi:hypothetical protein V2J09_010941 [Rumex salicifolius]